MGGTKKTFEEIKHRLIKPLILHMPNCMGRFHLYSDMSKFAMGRSLYQIQNGKPKLIACVSKRLPEAARNHSVTELELCSLPINMASFSHLLKRVDFDAIVDHLALTHIIKHKVELPNVRSKRLLELISSYSFNLYYIKGKDMILSNFLFRQKYDNSNPHDIIPISPNMHDILHERYYNLGFMDNFLVQTQSQKKSKGIILPEVHGVKKFLSTTSLPEKHKIAPQLKKGSEIKPGLGQGRVGIKFKKTQANINIDELTDKLQEILKKTCNPKYSYE